MGKLPVGIISVPGTLLGLPPPQACRPASEPENATLCPSTLRPPSLPDPTGLLSLGLPLRTNEGIGGFSQQL